MKGNYICNLILVLFYTKVVCDLCTTFLHAPIEQSYLHPLFQQTFMHAKVSVSSSINAPSYAPLPTWQYFHHCSQMLCSKSSSSWQWHHRPWPMGIPQTHWQEWLMLLHCNCILSWHVTTNHWYPYHLQTTIQHTTKQQTTQPGPQRDTSLYTKYKNTLLCHFIWYLVCIWYFWK